MARRQRCLASLLIVVGGLLPGCATRATPWTWYDSRVAELPDEQTVLVKLGNDFDYWTLEQVNRNIYPDFWRQTSARVLPGTLELAVGWPRLSVVFVAEAGETYTLYSHTVEKDDEVWIDVESHPRGGRRLVQGEIDFFWVEDSSGSVVFGEKPPRE